jgi:hypothetical protein
MVRLEARAATLVLDDKDPAWSELRLITGENELVLGKDSAEAICEHLRHGLERALTSGPADGTIAHQAVTHLVSLFEVHASLYLTVGGRENVLFVQDGDGSVVMRLTVSRQEVCSWISALRAYDRATPL